MQIRLPNNWEPRAYQLPVLRYLDGGGSRAVSIWHRRAGKDDTAGHYIAKRAFHDVGNYWHLFPVAAQARRAIWNGVNPHTGQKRLDEWFPPAIRARENSQEMMIEFVNGSTYQLLGSDNYDRAVGSSPRGVVFSEWALADPQAWAYVRPILLENKGWAWFITTPRGRNHAKTTYDNAAANADAFAERLPAYDTGVFTNEQLESERAEYEAEYGPDLGRSLFRQEYLCEFEGVVLGAIYADLLQKAEEAEPPRVTSVPHDPALQVYTFWDLGISDATAIWFVQTYGREQRVIDYMEVRNQGLPQIVQSVNAKDYNYAGHIWPPDGGARELGSGRTREETARNLGLRPLRVLEPKEVGSVADGISAARTVLPMCVFDGARCAKGLDALRSYRYEWDEKKKDLKPNPLHDWASHGADAFRYFAMGRKQPTQPKRPTRRQESSSSWMSM
ncbi:MAG: hypothetical protein AAFQ67_09985 [Pseudomonadota bacterium]